MRKKAKLADIRVNAPALEAMVVDTARGRLYVDLPEENALDVVNLSTRKLVARWPLKGGRANMALALDAAHHLLYVGCRDTSVRGSILVVDENSGKELKRLPIGGWVDSLFYDPQHGLIYASCGVGEFIPIRLFPAAATRKLLRSIRRLWPKPRSSCPPCIGFLSPSHIWATPRRRCLFLRRSEGRE